MKIWPNVEQQSEEWFRVRAGRPTASQFKRLLTPTGKDSTQWEGYAFELIDQCIRPGAIPPFAGNRHTDRGNELEPAAREEFARLMELAVEPVGFVTRDDGIVGCSPDSFVCRNGKRIAGLEIKCPDGPKHAADLIAGVCPQEHFPQVHGSMAVTGLDHWYFMSYCPGYRPLIVRVDRNDYTAKLSDAIDRFVIYYSEMRKQVIPTLIGKEAA